MNNNYKIRYTDLVCLTCGNITTIQRIVGRSRNVGHIKNLYCYVCKSEQKHYEVQDVDLFKLKYQEYLTKKLTKETNQVLNAIKERENNEGHECRVLKKVSSTK